jgi:hypothetical protein
MNKRSSIGSLGSQMKLPKFNFDLSGNEIGLDDCFWRDCEVSKSAPRFRLLSYTRPIRHACETSKLTQLGHCRRRATPCIKQAWDVI